MPFQKGNKLNLGKRLTDYQKSAVSLAQKGKPKSEEHKKKLSLALKGRKCPWVSERNKLPKSEKTKKKMHFAHLGEKNPSWRGGKGSERHRLMQQRDYILWRTAVFMRDDYTCQECGDKGIALEADHIKPWALYPELRYAIDNGRTLCKPCHQQTETYPVNLRGRVAN